MRPAPLLTTDGVTITVSKLPDGKFQVAAHAWTDPAVVGRDQVLEIRTHNGRLYLVRREKIREPEDWNDEEQTNGVGSSDDIADF
jgi:hypothetical protein